MLAQGGGVGGGVDWEAGAGAEAVTHRMDNPLYSVAPVLHRTGAIFNIL